MRLDKWLSNLKYGSRKQIEQAVKAGRVTVNQHPVSQASMLINPSRDVVTFDGDLVHFFPGLTLMMHKRAGVVCAHHDARFNTIFDDLPEPYARHDLHMAGRLDRDVTGMMILSVDGTLIHRIINPHKDVFKTYQVETAEPVTNLRRLHEPLVLKDGRGEPYTIKPPQIVSSVGTTTVIKISEGKHHQVKKMFAALGHPVLKLTRTAIGGLLLDETLSEGDVKRLTEAEIAQIFT